LLVTLPNPLGTGTHSASERFTYLPALMIALAVAVTFLRMARSANPMIRAAAVALCLNYLSRLLWSGSGVDVVVVWEVLLICLAAGYVLWRQGWLEGRFVLIGVLGMVSSQISFIPLNEWLAPLVLGLIVLAGAFLAKRDGWWPGALCVLLLSTASFVTVPLFWCAVALRQRCAWAATSLP
jgi:hypothetical protein